VQGVDHEPGGGGSAATVGIPGGFRLDPAQVAVLLQQAEDWLQVGGLAEAATGGLVGVAAAELHLISSADPVQQPPGVTHARVGAHQVEHGPGVLDQVVGQPERAGEGVGADRVGPAVAQVIGQVQQGGEAAGGAGEPGRPAGQVGQIAAAGRQAGLKVAFEGEQQLVGVWVEAPRRVVGSRPERASL
jgi:hypothetical protein